MNLTITPYEPPSPVERSVKCPYCQHTVYYPSAWADKVMECGNCHGRMLMPVETK